MHYYLINSFFTLISFATATGVILHDTRVDKAALVSTLPILSVSPEAGAKLVHISPNDVHTHVERGSVAKAFTTLHSTTPGIAPRSETKKHLLQRYVGKGHHAFDNYNLPLV